MKITRTLLIFIFTGILLIPARPASILIPMDDTQKNHLKAYGIAYWVLQHDIEIYWLLNYRGGSYMFLHAQEFEDECIIRGVSYQVMPKSR